MKKAANIFSKCIFWIENVAYIILMMFYFLFMVPLNYFIVLGNIFKLATGCRRIGLFFFWILFGTLVMIFQWFKDMFFFMRVLCNYQDGHDNKKEKEEEEFK